MSMSLVRRCLIAGPAAACVLSVLAPLGTTPALAATGHARHAGRTTAGTAGRAVLTGQVRDGLPLQGKQASQTVIPDGLPTVSGAVVSVPGLGQATTDAAGGFSLTGAHVSPGTAYTVTVTKPGYGQWRESGVRLYPGDPAQVYVELHTAAQRLHVVRVPQPDNGPAQARSQRDLVPCGHNSSGWTSQTEEPPDIRVWMTGARTVNKYDFEFYEDHVLPYEWEAGWNENALEAGAVAIRDYAWYWVVNGSKGTLAGSPNPCSFDVDDSTTYQNFQPGQPTYASTDNAVTGTEPYLFTHNGNIPETSFNAGPATCGGGEPAETMSQNGSQVCAADDHDGWQKILSVYYTYTLSTHGNKGPAAAADSADNQYVFWKGGDAGLWETHYTAAGNHWSAALEVPNMGPLGSAPTVALGPMLSSGSAEQYVYWRGQDGNLWQAYYDGSWHGPTNLGNGPLGSQPTAAADSAGDRFVFWEGTAGALWEDHYVAATGAWTLTKFSSDGPLGSPPSVASDSTGTHQYVYWEGTGGALWQAQCTAATNACSGPQDLGDGPLGSTPTSGVDSAANRYVFWGGTNTGLWETHYTASSGTWSSLNSFKVGTLGSAPTLAVGPMTSSGSPDQYVFWKGTDLNLWETWWDGTKWNGPISLGDGPLG